MKVSTMRAWEHAKTLLLVALIVSSLVLSMQVWLGPSVVGGSGRYPQPFVLPGARGDVSWQELVQPRWLALHLGGDRHAWLPPGAEPIAPFLWGALGELALALGGDDLKPIGPAEIDRAYVGADDWLGVEASLPGQLSLVLWQQLWSGITRRGAPAAGVTADGVTALPIDRLSLFVAPERALIAVRTPAGYYGREFAFDDLAARRVDAAARSVLRLLTLAAGELELTPATILTDVAGLRVAPGLVAANPEPAPALVQLSVPAVDWDPLVRAFFRNPPALRQVLRGTLRIYTDGEASVSVQPQQGRLEYQAPGALGAAGLGPGPERSEVRPLPTLGQALARAAAFGNEHGGWPEGVYLAGVTVLHERGALAELGQRPQPKGFRLEFGLRIEGLSVDGPPVVVAEVGAGGVTTWIRRFAENRLQERIALPLQPAQAAIARMGELALEELPAASRLLRDIDLVYADFGDGFHKPAWRLRMSDGAEVYVDAWNVNLYRLKPGG